MRGTFRLVLAAMLALACGLALAATSVPWSGPLSDEIRPSVGPKLDTRELKALMDSFPNAVVYAQVGLKPAVSAALADTLDSLSGWDATPRGRQLSLRLWQKWSEYEPHPLLDSMLPGARVFDMYYCTQDKLYGHEARIYFQGELLYADGLNRMLQAAGYAFVGDEVSRIARLAVLLWTLERWNYTGHDRSYLNARPTRPATFPAATFLPAQPGRRPESARWDLADKQVRDAMRVDCVVDGRRCLVAVAFSEPDTWARRKLAMVTADSLFTVRFADAALGSPATTLGQDGKPRVVIASATLKDSFPDAVSYPATLLGLLPPGPTADSFHRSAAAWAASPNHAHTKIYLSQPHALLARLLPRATFARAYVDVPPEYRGIVDIAKMDGRLYGLGALNNLLLAARFSFDSTEMSTMAKMAVLFATFGKSFPDTGYIGWHPYPLPAHGFPAITFLSVKSGGGLPPYLTGPSDGRRGLYIDCLLDGRRTPMFVGFTGNRHPQPEEVFILGGEFLQRYEYAWPDGH